MRIAKYISAFVVMLATVGCTMIDLDELSWKENTGPSGSAVTVLGHITRYDGCEVSSRADNAKKPELGETRTTCMAFAVFKMEEDAGNYTVGPLVHYEFQASSDITFVLEREGAMHDDDGNGTGDTEVVYEDDALYAMYVFANIHNMPATWAAAKGMTLEQMKAYAYAPKAADYNKAVGVGIPSDGFPMIGSLGDCSAGGDGHKLDLVVMDGTTMRVPTVDGAARDLLEVPLDVMYAKFRFEISLNPDQVVPGMESPTFQMHEYTIHNLSSAVTFDKASNTYVLPEIASVASFEPTVEISGEADGTQDGKVEFEFYIPEMCVTPATASTAYDYPFRGAPGGTPSASDPGIRKEDEELRQRYKPVLLGDGQKAAYITIHGTYRDHQHHSWEVYYDIYLGSDNYSNFDVDRNTLYSNYITIGGIQNSNDHSEEDQAVSMDHRVDIQRKLPFIVGLRRECSLDAHFEVRPLRIRLDDDYGGDPAIPANAAVQVSVSYLDDNRQDTTLPDAQKWVGLERSYGDGVYNESTESGTYIHVATTPGEPMYPSNGKRKYFTTDLTYNTLVGPGAFENGLSTSGGQTVIVPMPKQPDNSDEQCVWIYVDECTEASTDIEAMRFAKVVLTYGTVSGNTFTADSYWQPVTYILCQHKLYEVTYEGRTYHIEHEEEYLYNFDSEDTFSYSPTFDDGMVWGLNGVQLSKEHRSFTNNTNNSSWTDYVNNNTLPTYDFYIAKHDGTLATVAGATMVHRSAGRHFTEDIVAKSNNGVKNLTMAEQPSGAVEYCYNRNKRNTDGSIAKVEWYLPATDEIEDILDYGYGLFNGVFQNNFYWSSQPAYIRNVYYYEDSSNTFPFVVYDDNPAYARATKVNAKGGGVFEYALSGLNQATNVVDPSTGKILDFTGSDEINAGYYYMMYRWKSGTPDTTFGQDGFGGEVNGTQYKGEEFGEKLGGSSTSTRYHVHLGHLYDMVQEGYHHRTESNRVRCVRKDYSDDEQEQAVLVYKVSPTPATSLDQSGNTLYVMQNANYQSTYLTTSGTTVAASNSAVGINNLVVVKGNKVIKSVAKGQYFNGTNSNVSLSNSATNYTITASGQGYTISVTTGWFTQTKYYLKQTNNTTVQMQTGESGNLTWYFYEVEIE